MYPKNKFFVNVTDIVSWLYCPRKLYLTKIKKIKQPLTKPMLIGRIKHNILESFSKSEQRLVSSISKDYDNLELFIIYENFLKKISSQIFLMNNNIIDSFHLDRQEIFKKVLDDFSEDLKIRILSIKKGLEKGFFKEQLWNNLSPKYISELKLSSDNLELKGRVDRIEINNKKEMIPYELKTRAGKIYHSDELQLTAYAMLLQDAYKKPIIKGIIESGPNKQEIPITYENKQEVLEIIKKIKNLINDPIPEMQSNFNKCRNCGLKNNCI